MKRWATRLHAWAYRRSGGRVLGSIGGQPVLLLHTTGRRSGQTRTTPVQYMATNGDSYVIVAADHGARHPPAWYLNLRADAHGRVRVREQNFDVSAREASGDERTDLWRELIAANRYLPKVESKAGRQLPLLVLAPRKPPAGSTRASVLWRHRPATDDRHDGRYSRR